MVCKCKSVWMA